MEKSTNYNFNLPNSANDEIADINDISDNFRIIDEIMNETDQTFEPTSTKAASGKAVAEALSGYVASEVGKGLSSNDFTDEDKEKLNSALQNEDIDQTYSPTSTNAQSGKAVAEAVLAEQKRASNAFANALRGSAEGLDVSLTDVSPNEHTLGVKVRGKNLISYPYIEDRTQPINGITWTLNPDGSITANGTATSNSVYWLTRRSLMPGQTYTISTSLSTSVQGCTLVANYYPIGASNYQAWLNASTAKTGVFPSDGDKLACYCLVVRGTTVENVVFKPQIEEGSIATAYTPYISDLSTVTVTRYGKNLIPYPYAETRTAINGITVTYNPDNSIVFNGTATAQFWFKLFDNIPLPAGNYYLTGTPSDYGAGKSFLYIYNSSGKAYNAYNADGVLCVLPKDTYSGKIFVAAGQVFENVVFKPQLELGSTATAYESYQGQTYTPTADGTVSGVKSLYPTSTLTTDTSGVVISAEYNKDINKAFAEMRQAIISLGGNV